MTSPKCFFSYSWDSPSHKEWVRSLAKQLQQNGVHTFLDQWDVSLGDQLPKYMESSIRESDFVLLICTPNFVLKANTGMGGVGYEKSIVTGEIFLDSAPETKFVALLRNGTPEDALPSYLKSKAYLDFRNDSLFDQNLEELLRHFFKKPKFYRPPLGVRPHLEPHPHDNQSGRSANQAIGSEKKSEAITTALQFRPNYDDIESMIKSYGAQIMEFRDRKVIVLHNGKTISYHKPKRSRKPVKESFLKEIEKFFKISGRKTV